MVWCLIKHRANFTFGFNKSTQEPKQTDIFYWQGDRISTHKNVWYVEWLQNNRTDFLQTPCGLDNSKRDDILACPLLSINPTM
jgi:hypothetical protein